MQGCSICPFTTGVVIADRENGTLTTVFPEESDRYLPNMLFLPDGRVVGIVGYGLVLYGPFSGPLEKAHAVIPGDAFFVLKDGQGRVYVAGGAFLARYR